MDVSQDFSDDLTLAKEFSLMSIATYNLPHEYASTRMQLAGDLLPPKLNEFHE